MGQVEDKLSKLGELLPDPKKPVANYLGCKRSGNTLYVSGRVSPIRGEVGTDLTVAEAQVAAKSALLCIVNTRLISLSVWLLRISQILKS